MDGDTVYKKSTGPDKYDYDVGWLNEETGMFSRREMDDVKGVPKGYKIEMVEAWTRLPDFEKIIPTPKIIEEVGSIHSGIETAVKKKYDAPHSDNILLASLQLTNRQKQTMEFEGEDQKKFELACKAYEETGHPSWYDWNIHNWGTKWNAYGCEKVKKNIYLFETAWSGVPNLIQKIHDKYPSIKIDYYYADEDTGYNVGHYTFENGKVLKEDMIEGGSDRAYEIAFELRPDRKDDYEYIDGKGWEWKDEDE